VNNTPQAQKARFQTEAAIDHVDVVGREKQQLAAQGGAWSDDFAPLALRIYELNGTGGPLPAPRRIEPPGRTDSTSP